MKGKRLTGERDREEGIKQKQQQLAQFEKESRRSEDEGRGKVKQWQQKKESENTNQGNEGGRNMAVKQRVIYIYAKGEIRCCKKGIEEKVK